MTATAAPDAVDALALIRLHELVRTGRRLLEELEHELEDYDARVVYLGSGLCASSGRQRTVVKGVEALLDIAEMAYEVREPLRLRRYGRLDVASGSLTTAASDWLVAGIADTQQLKLAARLLPSPNGPLAFARALVSSEHLAVTDATVRDVLRAFPDLPARHVDRVGADARIDVDTPLNSFDGAAIHRLAEALTRIALEPSPNDSHP